MTVHKFDLQSADYMRNPFPTLAAMRAAGPVIRLKVPLMGKVWCATTHEAVGNFLKAADRFASDGRNVEGNHSAIPRWMPKNMKLLAENMLLLDDPDHRRLRKLVDAPFLARNIDAWRPDVARIADELLDQMERDGNPDIVSGFARALPLRVISELLGLAGGDQREQFLTWTDKMTRSLGIWMIIQTIPALGKMMRYIRGEIAAARAGEREGLLVDLVRAEADGMQMTEDELVAMVAILFVAGHETTTHLISTGLATLLDCPDQLAILKTDGSLMPQAVEELHRLNCPVQMTKPRVVRHDMDYFGQPLKRGDRIIASLAAANADPVMFPEPERFDIHRDNAARHAGFGGGIHLCLGLHLARAEGQIALERLFARWPDLQITQAYNDREWIRRIGIHGYRRLPVDFGLQHKRAA
ncbi:Cytochrome P450 [Parasphingorhabdus marina DSM 22363]|uniref:Cytochrome P450 n=1 Tax=Parasphingorhabdus marina DSM 22363 TaxID=1123272 RepID=A0A1N6CN34_9SPHN|nr:cytochrome P450 [Parasphingorhabdus marina]SIN59980.1 Cytochrome P450 [Parasphingorhabdus marina DSM 22363]